MRKVNSGELSRRRVVEWDTAKISADARARVGGAKDRREIHESNRRDVG